MWHNAHSFWVAFFKALFILKNKKVAPMSICCLQQEQAQQAASIIQKRLEGEGGSRSPTLGTFGFGVNGGGGS